MNANALPSPGALDGVTVLDLSRLLPGPYCSMILADHGAAVIAIEDKRQYAADGLFLPTVQRNKRHMTLDLKTDAGKEIFMRMARGADVIIEGFRPGVAARLGVDYDSVRQVKPDIIYCAITGYGQTGPCRDQVGHDVNYLARAGALDLMGDPDRPPSIPGIQIADIAAGGMNGAIGILLALYARNRTGRGQYIDIAMTDGMLAMLPVAHFWHGFSGQAPRRGDHLLGHRYACYNTYATADDRAVAVGALENRFWRRLCEAMDMAQYADLQFDEARRAEIIDAFRRAFRRHPLSHWETVLGGQQICVSAVHTLEQALCDPLFRKREMVAQIETPEDPGETHLGVPIKLSVTPGTLRTPSARFGQHTTKILAEYGYSETQIRQLQAQKVV
ncbi:CaiB/BaiF CoA transferase family protein [Desulfatitalea alkaliphila]|uniref:CoA transferase n=1 Tax=Desulfatitalea alkaliphila TaxID=2929485 RepID=A0AA41QYQ9_9BACT|nr:CaiB/BaiF CoA-transferase family protein [Desulfatitalea alkaliphila]MCJ8499487.1 CoA transferase [Desulfatitalea alkaliphila]